MTDLEHSFTWLKKKTKKKIIISPYSSLNLIKEDRGKCAIENSPQTIHIESSLWPHSFLIVNFFALLIWISRFSNSSNALTFHKSSCSQVYYSLPLPQYVLQWLSILRISMSFFALPPVHPPSYRTSQERSSPRNERRENLPGASIQPEVDSARCAFPAVAALLERT